ncbi:MAG: O-phospho-L-seryl-tRNA:Cys-tRNA synthase [Candidatus Odinarchaeota archaeon]
MPWDVCEVDNVRRVEEDYINLNPIQRAGVLTSAARKALISYGDGYSTCDLCLKPFRLDKISKPPIGEFYQELAEWLNMDVARVMPGARRGFQAVALTLLKPGDIAVGSVLSHYTVFLAVEEAGASLAEVNVDENYVIRPEFLASKIEEIRRVKGKDQPKLVILSHVDYLFGNMHPIQELIKVAKEYGVPFLYNGAYTVGVMPVDGKTLGADFIVGSGHKSMASPAPTGVLAMSEEWASRIFSTTRMKGDVSGRSFGIKETHLLGCTVMGAPLLAMMASFPYVKERVKRWDEEVEKARFFVGEFEKIEGNRVLGQKPRMHTLMKLDTTGSFDKIAQAHKKKGYFLYHELDRRNITGIFPGATRNFKINVYGLTWDQIRYVAEAFKEIAANYNIRVSG